MIYRYRSTKQNIFIEENKMKSLIRKMAILPALLAFTIPYCHAQLPEIQSRSNLSCMIGGVGLEESALMREEAKKWPLNIEFSERLGNSDAWVSGVKLVILNKDGRVIFDEACNGPMFLAKLSPGSYQLQASYEGVTKKRNIQIVEGKSLKESFNWSLPKKKD